MGFGGRSCLRKKRRCDAVGRGWGSVVGLGIGDLGLEVGVGYLVEYQKSDPAEKVDPSEPHIFSFGLSFRTFSNSFYSVGDRAIWAWLRPSPPNTPSSKPIVQLPD